MSAPKVFISYSHDSDDHRELVLQLSERLRDDGIETLLDRYVNGSPRQGWPRWMLDQLDAADSVLVICTETYYRRFRGQEEPGKGKGVDWEGALITQEIYDARSKTLKFFPVLFSADQERFIPEPLRSATHYTLTSADSYQSLYDSLLGQAGVEPGELGVLKTRARREGKSLTFPDEGDTQPIAVTVDISRIVKYAPAELIGREEETKLLSDAWDKVVRAETKRPHVLTFVALGGEGKTSLVAKWTAELAHQDWPGCDTVFAWSFYSQGTREQTAASSDLFLKEALAFFGDLEMASSAQGAYEKGRRLAQLVSERRALLILDGVEPLQYAPTSPTPGELKDAGLTALLKGLAATSKGLCVVTSRYSLPDLKAFWQNTALEVSLKRLSREAGAHLLQTLGVKGSPLRNIPINDGKEKVNEFEKLVEDVQGHALTLNLLGTYLRDAHAGDIRKRDLVKLEEADTEEQGGHAFRVMDAYVKSFESEGKNEKRALAILRLLGLFDRPVTADCLRPLLKAPRIMNLTEPLVGTTETQRNLAFTRLESARLLTVNRDASGALISLDGHPLVRDYFATQLRMSHPGAWRAGHRRLYKHLVATTHEDDQPTLEDLQPLYQAVVHGCQAGLQQEACDNVYYARIQRAGEAYSTKKLGAFGSDLGAVASFFESPWSHVSAAIKEKDQAYLLNQAAFRLSALGRLTEALEPMRAATNWAADKKDWEHAAIGASNFCQLELTLGKVAEAVIDAGHSVDFANLSGDSFQRESKRTTLAKGLHQAGRRSEAETLFREAEQMQGERKPQYPFLYALQGFWYCDLLLTNAERSAWHLILEFGGKPWAAAGTASTKPNSSPPQTPSPNTFADSLQSCAAVSERASKALSIAVEHLGLLEIALDHVTLGRAALYAAILELNPQAATKLSSATRHNENIAPNLSVARAELEGALIGLRRADWQDHIARGLLTSAWLLFLSGRDIGSESAQEDLDEAWEIAERGPMRLHMADIHLYRARLFHDVKPYPWDKNSDGTSRGPKDDLAAARKLIEQCGYWRRKEELEDAEEAAKNW